MPDVRLIPEKMPLLLPISLDSQINLNLRVVEDIERHQLPPKPLRKIQGVRSRYLKYGKSEPITLVQ